MKHFKKAVAILLLLFTSFLVWLDSYEPKKEPFKHSDFYIENVKSNEKIFNNSKLYNEEYRNYLQNKIQEKEKEKQEQQEEQEQEQEQEQEPKKKSKSRGRERGRKRSKKVKEENGKIKEKTQRARTRKEQENNRLDKYIFKKRMKSKKRP
uniref:Uncharacterized protein n=1 Tax=Siphoviridae sp. ctnR613 TaxID=2827939 RepID=A0A8S5SPA7_9CAUD|nr:MAG TPA: hypothetical protein [Siphoviridae sp. ctnR613]